MCLGIPGRVIKIFHEHDVLMGKVDFSGVSKQVCLEHVPQVQIGQYVLVHVGFALSSMDQLDELETHSPETQSDAAEAMFLEPPA
jgi:hydrogenase expression/formation protein HypC